MGDSGAEVGRNRFQSEAGEVLGDIKRAFGQTLATLGVRRPVELQKALKLDPRLSWQICRVAWDVGELASGPLIPSRVYVSRFIDAATAAGVPAGEVASLAETYDRFEQLVQRHAGDRTSFNSLVAAAAGETNDEWIATDVQHRRNMFRGECHVMGVHAQTRVVAALLERAGTEGGFRLVTVSGYVGIRVLRSMDRVRIHGFRLQQEQPTDALASHRHRPLTAAPDGFLLEEFSTRPLPATQVSQGESGESQWIQTFLVKPEVGNLGLTTVMFGEHYRLDSPPTRLSSLLLLPSEVLVMDLLVAPGVLSGPPQLSVFRGDDQALHRPPDVTPLLGDHRVQSLGKGTGGLATADVPRLPEMVRVAAGDLAGDVETFEVWRVRLEYPVYQSTVRLLPVFNRV